MNRIIIQTESLVVFAGSIATHFILGYDWILLAVLFFAPDASMAGYLVNNNVGAKVYNVFHNYAIPLLLLAAGYFLALDLLVSVGLIWIAHIAMDRAIGYGLKYATGFKDTHILRL